MEKHLTEEEKRFISESLNMRVCEKCTYNRTCLANETYMCVELANKVRNII